MLFRSTDRRTIPFVPLLAGSGPNPLCLTRGLIATLLGLLGTIVGLIEAFEALEKATPETRQKLLARGIALAMNTTAFGLIVAIPTLIFHMILSSMTKKILDEIDMHSVKLENLLISRGKSGGAVE